jgi:Protein of unknown function (DUF1569)
MALPNVFTKEVSDNLIERINKLNNSTAAQWGKMSVSQMLSHCNVTYELAYENIHPRPNFLMKFILKSFIKKIVTSETPYKHNSQTAPVFLIKTDKDFNKEKDRLIQYIQKTQELGEVNFNNKESISFGNLSSTEWNNMFYKHLNHHLSQFAV